MKKLFSMFSSRPHHDIAGCNTPPRQEHRKSNQFDQSELPIMNLQDQTYSYLENDRPSITEFNQAQVEEVNEEISKQQASASVSYLATAPVIFVKKEVDPRIKTVRIRLIDNKSGKDLNMSRVSNCKQTFKAEIKAKDQRFKQISKTIYIFYTVDELISQINRCTYFNGFKPLNFSHIKKSLFPNCEDGTDLTVQKKKKTSIQQDKYYVTFTDEGEYHGQMNKNKAPEGNSILYYQNGNIYTGEMKNRFRQGQGTMVYPDGSSYTGGWVLDSMDGQGKETDSKGDVFIGSFSNNARNGKGTLKQKNGYLIECNWVNGYQDGPATLNAKNQKISVIFSRGQIVKVNQTAINDISPSNGIDNLPPHLVQIRVNRDKVQVSHQQMPACLTARF